MQKYIVSQFDGRTYVVFDEEEQREFRSCGNYDEYEDAEERAVKIASLLNQLNKER